jgi:DNA (cytosine-5)-methyltransferase 1
VTAYYNEFDKNAAAWLRELIAGGHIAPGVVDERDIRDVNPDELRAYDQCHFFAGIGGWSLALRRAGWPDDRPVWTGSCPCQPFSAAGKRGGTSDERHLWPHWFHLIDQCRPPVVFGEQVASKDGLGWFDLVSADLEGSGYAVGAADLCAAGVGAPHIRQRLWFVGVADAERYGQHGRGDAGPGRRDELPDGSAVDRMEHASGDGRLEGRGSASGRSLGGLGNPDGARSSARLPEPLERQSRNADVTDHGGRGLPGPNQGQPALGGLADAGSEGRWEVSGSAPSDEAAHGREGRDWRRPDADHLVAGHGQDRRPGPVNGFWRDADWLLCRDGKWRPVEPGTFPLAHGVSGRVGLLRGYGNAISPEAAQAFIEASLEALDDVQRLRLMSDLAGDVFG